MNTQPVQVLYIAGTGRSGSTLIANVLGSVDGVFSAGELRFAWERGLADGALCGCRRRVVDCPIWSEVFGRAFGSFDQVKSEHVQAALADRTRIRNLPRAVRDRGRPNRIPDDLQTALQSLYEAVVTTTGSRLIIDSSKLPSYALLLSELPGIDVKILHLVRDPRAAAWSWMRRRATGTVEGYEEPMDRFSAAKSASLWSIWNGSTRRLWRRQPDRYLMIRYEDFVADPEEVTAQILEFAGLPDRRVVFDGPGTLRLSPNHAIAGNPNRMRNGETSIKADSEWENAMPARDRITVSALTAPLLGRFGYEVRS